MNGFMGGRMDCARMGAVVEAWADGWTFDRKGWKLESMSSKGSLLKNRMAVYK